MSERLEKQRNQHHAQATLKFPVWDHSAEFFLNTLQETNAKKGSLKGLDSYLLTYLEKMKEEAEAEAEGSAAAAVQRIRESRPQRRGRLPNRKNLRKNLQIRNHLPLRN